MQPMPVDGRVLLQLGFDGHTQRVAFGDPHEWAGHLAVLGDRPDSNAWGDLPEHLFGHKLEFADLPRRFGCDRRTDVIAELFTSRLRTTKLGTRTPGHYCNEREDDGGAEPADERAGGESVF